MHSSWECIVDEVGGHCGNPEPQSFFAGRGARILFRRRRGAAPDAARGQQARCCAGATVQHHAFRPVSLTEAGRALLPHANAIIRSLDQASQTIQDLSGEVGGRLRLATSHHVGLHRLPPVLRQFSERFPAVSLDIEFMDSEQAYDEISRGAVELAIVTLAPR